MGSFMNYAGVVHALKATAEVHRREDITDGEVMAVAPQLEGDRSDGLLAAPVAAAR